MMSGKDVTFPSDSHNSVIVNIMHTALNIDFTLLGKKCDYKECGHGRWAFVIVFVV